jgi:hypothetical protein
VVESPFAFQSHRHDLGGFATSLRPSRSETLELGHGPILLLRVVDLVETGTHSPLAALVKVSPAPMVVR